MPIAALCVQRPVFAAMLISFLVVLGIFSFRDLGVDLFPRTDPATVTINAQLPGASAEEVEDLGKVVKPRRQATQPHALHFLTTRCYASASARTVSSTRVASHGRFPIRSGYCRLLYRVCRPQRRTHRGSRGQSH